MLPDPDLLSTVVRQRQQTLMAEAHAERLARAAQGRSTWFRRAIDSLLSKVVEGPLTAPASQFRSSPRRDDAGGVSSTRAG